ncbi:MAG: molybdopterin-binding protein [Erysipelotrichaceae bacterium]|nr:molybdopterin-binding protein [Erysipelotrichaceae bacterium]MDY5251163.1 molybdopterin-binding protein [Erysipelotrichaceae bacterium]
MELIETEKAVGCVLCHDITQIIKGKTKDAIFRKGHIVTEEDIPVLLSVGKRHLYVWKNDENMLHENDAALILKDACKNAYMSESAIKEGKIELIAECDGILKIDTDRLLAINMLEDIMIATIHQNQFIRKGQKIAGMRVIPLVIEKAKLEKVKEIYDGKPLLEILPMKAKKVGIVTTGSEVYHGLIKDAFGPVIRDKMAFYGCEVVGQTIVDDNLDMIKAAIKSYLDQKVDMVVCTGGMSVDPDDLTPSAIKSLDGELVSYGAPVLPGAMFLLSYMQDGTPVLGLPGCVMYHKTTIFDLAFPRLLCNEKLTKKDLAVLGHGGLCHNCAVCHYPNCEFGK